MSSLGSEKQSSGTTTLAGKYLTFSLAAEQYGVEILKIQEIIGVMNITIVPKSPNFIKGVINLRGRIIPVIDLRLKLNMPPAEYDEKTCIIITQVDFGTRKVPIGVVVDTVLEVVNFQAAQIEAAPNYGQKLNTSFILGMGRITESVVVLLDINKALADAVPASVLNQEAPAENDGH